MARTKKVITAVEAKKTLKEAAIIHANRTEKTADELIGAMVTLGEASDKLGLQSKECKQTLMEKYTSAQIELDFGQNAAFETDGYIITTRDVEEDIYDINSSYILSLPDHIIAPYVDKKLNKDAVIKAAKAGTLDPAIAVYVEKNTQTSFKITQSKKK